MDNGLRFIHLKIGFDDIVGIEGKQFAKYADLLYTKEELSL